MGNGHERLVVSIAAVFILTALAGCVTTPSDVVKYGMRVDYSSTQPADALAKCVERNASELKWGLLGLSSQARVRDAAPGYEVLYGGDGATVAVARTWPEAGATRLAIWLSPEIIGVLQGEGTLEDQLARGCDRRRGGTIPVPGRP